MVNPKIKNGDKIILTKSRNGMISVIGQELTVTNLNIGGGAFQATSKTGMIVNIYTTAPVDEYCLATKENIVKHLKEKRDDLLAELKAIEEKLDFHSKYESDEDFVADKLDQLFSANSKGNSKKERVKLMSDVLKTLKESNLL